MTSATKILLIENISPAVFALQQFLWENGYINTQIIPPNTYSTAIQLLYPDLIVVNGELPLERKLNLPYSTLFLKYTQNSQSCDHLLCFPDDKIEILKRIKSLTNTDEPEEQREHLLIRQNGTLHKVAIADIMIVESNGNQVILSAKCGKKFSFNYSMLKMLEILPATDFLRIHKKYIIQFSLIDGIIPNSNTLLIQSHALPIGRTFKEDLLEKFNILN